MGLHREPKALRRRRSTDKTMPIDEAAAVDEDAAAIETDTGDGDAAVDYDQEIVAAQAKTETVTHDDDAVADDDDQAEEEETAGRIAASRRVNWARAMVCGVLPAVALLLAVAAGYLKWQDSSASQDATAQIESAQAAKNSTIAVLSYQPDKVDQQLGAARDLVTGEFREAYTQLTRDVVIPGAKQKQISTTASVPAVTSVSANEKHAVALVFVNQTTVIGGDPPTASTSAVRVTLEKVNGRWLISKFDPV
jgi:Mce-associated membrane protein